MKYYKVPEKMLRWYLKDFLTYNALKNGGLYDDCNRALDALDILYTAMRSDDEEHECFHSVFDYFGNKADNMLKYMEEKGLMEEKE